MSEAGGARLGWRHVVDDLVIVVRPGAGGNFVEAERLPHAPGDVVIGAGGVAADAERPEQAVLVIERETAAEGDDATDLPANQGIVGRAEFRGIAAVERGQVDGIGCREAVEIAGGLRAGVEIGGRKRIFGEAQRVGGVGLLGRDGAAPEPLVGWRGLAAEGERADDAIAGDERGPFVVVEAAVRGTAAWLDGAYSTPAAACRVRSRGRARPAGPPCSRERGDPDGEEQI